MSWVCLASCFDFCCCMSCLLQVHAWRPRRGLALQFQKIGCGSFFSSTAVHASPAQVLCRRSGPQIFHIFQAHGGSWWFIWFMVVSCIVVHGVFLMCHGSSCWFMPCHGGSCTPVPCISSCHVAPTGGSYDGSCVGHAWWLMLVHRWFMSSHAFWITHDGF